MKNEIMLDIVKHIISNPPQFPEINTTPKLENMDGIYGRLFSGESKNENIMTEERIEKGIRLLEQIKSIKNDIQKQDFFLNQIYNSDNINNKKDLGFLRPSAKSSEYIYIENTSRTYPLLIELLKANRQVFQAKLDALEDEFAKL